MLLYSHAVAWVCHLGAVSACCEIHPGTVAGTAGVVAVVVVGMVDVVDTADTAADDTVAAVVGMDVVGTAVGRVAGTVTVDTAGLVQS